MKTTINMTKETTSLEKRLIALSAHGIVIYHADGHRWIESQTTYSGFNFDTFLKENNISVNNKIYGGVEEALDVVDEAFSMGEKSTLEDWYNNVIDPEWDVKFKSGIINRVEKMD